MTSSCAADQFAYHIDVPKWQHLSCAAADHGSHGICQAPPLFGREAQTELRAPPQYIILGLGPLPLHQIAHLRSREVGADAGPEVLEAPRGPEHTFDARAIGAHQAPRVLLAQKWPRLARFGHECLDAVIGKFAARQMRVLGPCRSDCDHLRKTVERMFSQAAISRDLAAVNS